MSENEPSQPQVMIGGTPVNPNQPRVFEFSIAEMQVILRGLGKLNGEEMIGIFMKINHQLGVHLSAPQGAPGIKDAVVGQVDKIVMPKALKKGAKKK